VIILVIGLTTFGISIVGAKIGNMFGAKHKSKAEFIGGLILVAIGLKILIEHLFFT
jgi:putative Mn2+ efflux pump MntP